MTGSSTDVEVLELALKQLTKSLDGFVSDCLDESGAPKAPPKQSVAAIKAVLPSYCKNSYRKPKGRK